MFKAREYLAKRILCADGPSRVIFAAMRMSTQCLLVCCASMTCAAHAAGRVMLMGSPPGSCRSTQAEIPKKNHGMTITSADGVIARNSRMTGTPCLQRVGPHLDPALKGLLEPDIEPELKAYHREFDFIRKCFPEADIRTADGTKLPAEVSKQIRKMLLSRQS